MDVLHLRHQNLSMLQFINENAIALATKVKKGDVTVQRDVLQTLIHRVMLHDTSLAIDLSRNALTGLLEISTPTDIHAHNEKDELISLKAAMRLQRTGVETKLIIAGDAKARQPDADLCRLIAKARHWFDQLTSGEVTTVKEIAAKEKVFDTEITRILPLAFLAPGIIEDILNGRQPEGLSVKKLTRINPLPTDWAEQKKRLGYAD